VAHLLDRDHVLDDRPGAEGRQGVRTLGDVLAGHDGDHAGQRLGGLGTDGEDLGVRVRAAQDRGVCHALQLDVVDVAPLAAQEARVLDAVDALAEPAPRDALLPGRVERDLRRVRILLDDHREPPSTAALPACEAAWIDSTICW
jgi:hypothetical protein